MILLSLKIRRNNLIAYLVRTDSIRDINFLHVLGWIDEELSQAHSSQVVSLQASILPSVSQSVHKSVRALSSVVDLLNLALARQGSDRILSRTTSSTISSRR